MKKKYRLQKTAKNEFTKITGIPAIQLSGSSDCLVVDRKTIYGTSAQKYAYGCYFSKRDLSSSIKVKASCGINQCIKKEHLFAQYAPSNEEKEYIQSYKRAYGISTLSHILRVPEEVLLKYFEN